MASEMKSSIREENDLHESKSLHDTELLLKKFRRVEYAVRLSEEELNMRVDNELGIHNFTLQSNAELAGMDLSNTKLESRTRNLIRSQKMIAIIRNALDKVRQNPYDGEKLYQILYFSYISNPKPRTRECILLRLAEMGYPMTHTTYYRILHAAVNELDSILWGYTTQDCIQIIKSFLDTCDAQEENLP